MRLMLADCLEAMRELEDASVDAVVTDPPYGISFMAKHWDRFDIDARVGRRDVSQLGVRLTGGIETPNRKETARTASAYANAAGEAGGYDFSLRGNRAFQQWTEQWACEAFRVLKPGGHLLCFAATRTYHRMAAGVEDAGFEIRDCIAWMFGSGFPKSLDLSKAIDKSAGHWRGKAGAVISENASMGGPNYERTERGDPVTAAAAWEGWGTALKPAFEPIVMARKPLGGTVAATVLEHGTGALNIDACRIEANGDSLDGGRVSSSTEGWDRPYKRDAHSRAAAVERGAEKVAHAEALGRWPANVLLDAEAAAMLDEQTGELSSGANPTRRGSDKFRGIYSDFPGQEECEPARGADSGGASRFFYCAKVSRAERNAGLDGFDRKFAPTMGNGIGGKEHDPETATAKANVHPTVKPIDLMRWLLRLVTPPGGVVLDPFLGSGSTGCAAALEGFGFIGCEREAEYLAIAEARIAFWAKHGEDGLRIVRERDAAETKRQTIADAGQLDLLAEEPAA